MAKKKCKSITSMLLYVFLLLVLQFIYQLILDFPLVNCLFLFVLKLLLFYCLVLCLLQFLDLSLFYCFFLYLIQLFLILHLQLSKDSNKLYLISVCNVQLVLQSFFIYFRLFACCLTKSIASRLLIQHLSTLAYLPAIMLEKRLTQVCKMQLSCYS